MKEATEASITAARDTVVASAKILEEAIKKAEETTRTARKAARASVRVFEEAAAGAEKVSQTVEEPSELSSSKLFEEALSRIEPDESRLKPAPHEAKRDMRSRLEFLAKMYASEKDKPFEKSDSSQEDD